MIQPSNEVLTACSRISGDRNVQIVLAWMQESLSEQDRLNRKLEGAMLHRGQGAAITIDTILTTIQTAPETIRKREAGRRSGSSGF